MIAAYCVLTSFLAVSDAFLAPKPILSFPNVIMKAMTISTKKELLPGIEAIDKSNENLVKLLDPLTAQPYFRYYSVDILASCEYMPQELFECYTQSCEIYPEDTEAVSVKWIRAKKK